MGFQSFVQGLAGGLIETWIGGDDDGHEPGRMVRLCSELEWEIDERDGEKIKLHFSDSLVGKRKVIISKGDSELAVFYVFSHATVAAGKVPKELLGHLLSQNAKLSMCAWQTIVDDDGDVMFVLEYCALGEGLSARSMSHICQRMLEEVNEFDQKMSKAGFLS
jgi:hypothetical protein